MSDLLTMTTDAEPAPRRLGMRAWLATEGGSKCPLCGRYAKEAARLEGMAKESAAGAEAEPPREGG